MTPETNEERLAAEAATVVDPWALVKDLTREVAELTAELDGDEVEMPCEGHEYQRRGSWSGDDWCAAKGCTGRGPVEKRPSLRAQLAASESARAAAEEQLAKYKPDPADDRGACKWCGLTITKWELVGLPEQMHDGCLFLHQKNRAEHERDAAEEQLAEARAENQRLIDGIVVPAEVFYSNPGAPGKVCRICGYSTEQDGPGAGHSDHCVLAAAVAEEAASRE